MGKVAKKIARTELSAKDIKIAKTKPPERSSPQNGIDVDGLLKSQKELREQVSQMKELIQELVKKVKAKGESATHIVDTKSGEWVRLSEIAEEIGTTRKRLKDLCRHTLFSRGFAQFDDALQMWFVYRPFIYSDEAVVRYRWPKLIGKTAKPTISQKSKPILETSVASSPKKSKPTREMATLKKTTQKKKDLPAKKSKPAKIDRNQTKRGAPESRSAKKQPPASKRPKPVGKPVSDRDAKIAAEIKKAKERLDALKRQQK